MATLSFMPNTDDDKADLLEHLAITLPRYADLLGISSQDLAALNADALCFRYALQALGVVQAYSQAWTSFKNLLRDGGTGNAGWPAMPILPEPIPPAVQPGIIPRLSALAKHIKAHKNYTPAIGHDLWLIGAEQVIDTSTWKPILSVYSEAGHPVIQWTKGGASALEIWTDRGDGNNFVFLGINIEPNSKDSSPLPTTGAVWKYKAIYRLHDQQVGQWSDVISVAVGV
ncbi:hypothetical protein [Methylobacter sp. S3L5C]|uniref:hypothetical protein n=1 Tax=Methylobacter sp. S3L5C TaxID=2839024 RepID=UPI001FAD20FC|nr:hypothetical protein [Methylobacter sp. S3L5C]UOA08547.1 hypothetical protein KKZ03_20540 [Methylobacter sp. S3L5C]